jgi:hypothetical protein
MGLYHSPRATFDIHETDSRKWSVIHVPNLNEVAIGTGKFLATFDTQDEAKQFCDDWEPQQ